jgi:hypothetical protein
MSNMAVRGVDGGQALTTRRADHTRWIDDAGRFVERWPAMRAFLVIGVASVIAGGLVAAVTRPLALGLGSWLAAFMVLVGGVAQIWLGAGRAWLSHTPPTSRRVAVEVLTWNAGIAATIAGTIIGTPLLTSAGGVFTVAALVLFLASTWTASQGPTWGRRSYRGILIFVLASTPVGLVLSWARHG